MSSDAQYTYNSLQPYDVPSWAKKLKCQPSTYAQLAVRPTPIHRWELPGVPSGFQVFVKRDDLTGSTLTGNKIRKMEFLLAEALQQDCDCIATCGAVQSNHCRTAAVAARQLGLQTYLVLGQPSQTIDTDAVSCTGNMLQNRLSGTTVLVCSARSPEMEYDEMELLELKVQEYAKKLRAEGKKPYIIPQGASVTGAWGYFEAFNEMTKQGILENFDDMVIVMGGGDNLAALAIANYLTGSKLRVHGVSVYKNVGHFYKHAEKFLQAFGLTEDAEGKPLKAGDLADIIDGYQGPGYRRSSDEELALLTEINTKTGVMVDPGYNVKGVRGLLGEMQNNPGRFAGKRILYIHTGGLFGLYGGTLDQLLKNTPSTNQVYSYVDVVSDSLY